MDAVNPISRSGSPLSLERTGLQSGLKQFHQAAESLASGHLTAEGTAALFLSQRVVEANQSVIRVQDNLLGTLLDKKA